MIGSAVNAVDIIVLVVLGLTFLYGIIRGFVLQLAGIVFLVAGLVLADRLSPGFGQTLHRWFPDLGSPVDHWVAFGLILVATVVVGHLLALLGRGALEKLKLIAYDRFLGGILGVVKGAIVVILLLWLVVWVFDRGEKDESPSGLVRSVYESRTWPLVQKTTDTVLPLIPEDLRTKGREQLEQIRKEVDGAREGEGEGE